LRLQVWRSSPFPSEHGNTPAAPPAHPHVTRNDFLYPNDALPDALPRLSPVKRRTPSLARLPSWIIALGQQRRTLGSYARSSDYAVPPGAESLQLGGHSLRGSCLLSAEDDLSARLGQWRAAVAVEGGARGESSKGPLRGALEVVELTEID